MRRCLVHQHRHRGSDGHQLLHAVGEHPRRDLRIAGRERHEGRRREPAGEVSGPDGPRGTLEDDELRRTHEHRRRGHRGRQTPRPHHEWPRPAPLLGREVLARHHRHRRPRGHVPVAVPFRRYGRRQGLPCPAQVSAPVLLVNQTMLDSANAGKATDIRTFDDVVTAASKVTAKTGNPSVSLPTQRLPDWLGQGFVQGAGGTFVNADGTAGFGDATGIDALSLWTKLNERSLEARVNETDAISAFTSQQTALAFTATSMIASVNNTVGNGFEWTAVDLPTVNGGDGLLPAGGNGWIVLSDDGCRAAYANALVAELLGTEAVLAASGTDYSYIPVDKAAAEQLLATSGIRQPQRYAWTYDKELSPWGGFDGAVTSQINDVLRQMSQGLQSGSELEPTVKRAVTTIDSIVGQG
ncbi:extracellular solute-binding protein [Prescottella defluvii]|nr:extracellular solute-binding protein [Prescottella defluvii]